MTSKEAVSPIAASLPTSVSWAKSSAGYKVPFILASVPLLFLVWMSSPSSFLSFSQLSVSQIEIVVNSPADANLSPDPAVHDVSSIPAVQQDSPTVEKESDPAQQQQQSVDTGQAPRGGSPIENSTQSDADITPSNITADSKGIVSYSEDSQIPTSEEPTVQDDPPHADEEKYLVLLLGFESGTGNQLAEYKSGAVIARSLNRTLCLAPFFGGPKKHAGNLGDMNSFLYVEERFDIDVLSKFVKVAPMDECVQKCERKLDVHWRLAHRRPPRWSNWFNDTPEGTMDFLKNVKRWMKTADITADLGPWNEPRCAGLGGLFPGLRWKGVFFAASAYLQHSRTIMKATDAFQMRALGSNSPNYVSVHWRFEELQCRGHPLGLCFTRCKDGAVVANAHRSETWENMTREGGNAMTMRGFNGVFLAKEDVSDAIYDRAVENEDGVRNVYLATDGWLRGPESAGIVKWVVEDLRRKGLNVSGLWQIPDLPNFADGTYVRADTMAPLFGLLDRKETAPVSIHMIALVEQEICIRSTVFLGSGQSTWSLSVSDARRGLECKLNIEEQIKGSKDHDTSASTMDQEVIDKILTIQYSPGVTCAGSRNPMSRTVNDEGLDGWLDYESCEKRLLAGKGKCKRIST